MVKDISLSKKILTREDAIRILGITERNLEEGISSNELYLLEKSKPRLTFK